MSTPVTPDATSRTPGSPAPDSIDAAALAFQGILGATPTKEPPAKPSTDSQDTVEADDPTGTEGSEPDTTPEVIEGEESEPTGEEPDTEPGPTVRSRKLKFSDGTEAEVTEDEAFLGYLRQKDYTHKTQLTSEERKLLATERAEARESREQLRAQLDEAKRIMKSLVPDEPNFVELKKQLSPERFVEAVAQWQQYSARLGAIETREQELADEALDEAKRKLEETRAEEHEKLLAAVPEWRDTNAAQSEMGHIVADLRARGFKDTEIRMLVDHRVILALRDAARYTKLLKEKGNLQGKVRTPKGKIKPAPAGSAPRPTSPKSETERAKQKLRESGSLADAAAVFRTTLGIR